VVYGVVNNHRGFVQVESEVAVGTAFSVYLPVAEAAQQAPDDVPAAQRQCGAHAADDYDR
jgi:signal transduction histidine kinase